MEPEATNGIPQLKELYIFNPNLANKSKNTEVGEILYFYPEEEAKDFQLKKVGLCQAIIKFSSTFTHSTSDSLHTQKCRYIFYQPEDEYWFVLVLTIPNMPRPGPDGIVCIEYQNDQIQDSVFQSVLKRVHEKFILLHDSLDSILKRKGISTLRMKLKKFLKISINKLEINQCGLLEMYKGLQFYSMDRQIFLKIQCFINYLLITHAKVKNVVILQGNKLVWSGLGQSDIQAFYDYLVNDMLSQYILSGADQPNPLLPSYGVIFKRESHISLTVPTPIDIDTESSECQNPPSDEPQSNDSAQSTHVQNEVTSTKRRYHLLTFKVEQSYINLLVEETEGFEKEFIAEIDSFLSLHFTPLAKELTKSSNYISQNPQHSSLSPSSLNTESISSSVKYIYFNHLNLAEKYTPGCQCDLDSYRALADLKNDLSRMTENGEIVIKMVTDTWIVAKVSNKREFFAIFNMKGVNILEIDEEMRKLTDVHLKSIFFQD